MLLLLAFVLSSTALDFDLSKPYVPLNDSKLEWFPKWVSVGTWNLMLQPWFEPEWEKNVFKNLVTLTSPDILALQEVWTDEDVKKILNVPGRKLKYPYHYVPKARPDDLAGCDFSSESGVDIDLAKAYVGCMIQSGVPTNTLMQPLVPVPYDCLRAAIGIGISGYNPANQLCLACLMNTLEYLPASTPESAQIALQTCAAGQGPKYGHKGVNGQLILSKYPITHVSETQFDAFLVNRVNIHATIQGIKFGFGHFSYNVLQDIDPLLAPLMYGVVQEGHIKDFVDHKTEVVVGDLNTGPNYQSNGWDDFAQAGYSQASTSENTWCKDSHADFLPCPLAGGPPGLAIDHVLIRDGSFIYPFWARQFNEHPIAMSDHVGVAVELISVKCSKGLTAAIEKRKREKALL